MYGWVISIVLASCSLYGEAVKDIIREGNCYYSYQSSSDAMKTINDIFNNNTNLDCIKREFKITRVELDVDENGFPLGLMSWCEYEKKLKKGKK